MSMFMCFNLYISINNTDFRVVSWYVSESGKTEYFPYINIQVKQPSLKTLPSCQIF